MPEMRAAVFKLREAIDRNPLIHWMDPLARKLGLVELVHRVCNALEKDALAARAQAFCAFYDEHESDFRKLAEMLQDDASRYTLEKVLAYRKSYDMSVLKNVNVHPQYFQKNIFATVKDEVFVDGGAYLGDTIKSYLKNWGGGIQKNICLGTGCR